MARVVLALAAGAAALLAPAPLPRQPTACAARSGLKTGTIMAEFEARQMAALDDETTDRPIFSSGDTVNVACEIVEGSTKRIQNYAGVVIKRSGAGMTRTFTVRKMSSGIGVERTFPLYSPTVKKIEVVRRGSVRRSRLYYLRQLTGKSARIKEKVRGLNYIMRQEEEIAAKKQAAREAAEAAEAAAQAAAEAEAAKKSEEEAKKKEEALAKGEPYFEPAKETDEKKEEPAPAEENKKEEDDDDEEDAEKDEPVVDFEKLDVFGVEDIFDVGGGEPLFSQFQFEDWTMMSLRFELHLLAHAFRRDVNDADRPGMTLEHLPFYYQKYFKKAFNLKFYGVDVSKEVVELVRDTVVACGKNQVLESLLPDDMESHGVFVMLTEEGRRDRNRRIDLGDDVAKLKFTQPGVANSQGARPGQATPAAVRPPNNSQDWPARPAMQQQQAWPRPGNQGFQGAWDGNKSGCGAWDGGSWDGGGGTGGFAFGGGVRPAMNFQGIRPFAQQWRGW